VSLALPKLVCDAMTADSTLDGDQIRMVLEGTADSQSRTELDDYIGKLHVEAQRLGTKTVHIDLKELEFMNSSCLKIFVAWLAQLNDLGPEKQYKLVMHSNPQLLWQRRSLAALSCFAVDLVTVESA
jgi:hypothetical protein